MKHRPTRIIELLLVLGCLFAPLVAQDKILRVGDPGIKDPVLIKRVQPNYPELALKEHVESKVELFISIDYDGKVSEAIAVRQQAPARYGFAEAAEEAVREWVFQPATKDGIKIEVAMDLVISFYLDGKTQPLRFKRCVIYTDKKIARKPRAFMDKHYFAQVADAEQVLIDVALDEEGKVICYQLHRPEDYTSGTLQDMQQGIKQSFQQIRWFPATAKGIGQPSDMTLWIPVPY